jgi:drug/metabolite transporter (DMT)-like permease
MSLSVFLAVMVAALLHAGWNALIKRGTSKLGGMVLIAAVSVPVGAAFAATRPLPAAEVWPWLALSTLLHLAYMSFLARAYEHGDLSRVYPVARGTAPLIVLLVGPLVLPDRLTTMEIAGIGVMGAGLMVMARGVFSNGEARALLPFALATALATAGYTLSDGMGARVAGDAAGFVAWLFILQGTIFVTGVMVLRGPDVLPRGRAEWGLGVVAGLGSYAAYAIAVWAMTQAPVALVAALRESSILFAVLIGWLALGERLDRGKALAAALIVLGVALTRL